MSNRSLLDRLMSAGIWVIAAKLASLFAVLGLNMLLARMLTEDEFGAYFLFMGLAIFGGAVARLGMKQSVVRLIAEAVALYEPGKARDALRHIFLICALGGMAIAVLVYFYLGERVALTVFKSPSLMSVVWLLSLWIVLQAFMTPVASALKGFQKYGAAGFLDDINPALPSILLVVSLGAVYFCGVSLNLEQVLLISTGAFGVSLVVGVLILLRKWSWLGYEGGVSMRHVVSISAPVYVVNLATLLIAESSLWMVAYFSNPENVAIYGAALKLVRLVLFPLVVLNMIITPFISELYAKHELAKLENILRSFTTLAAYPSLFILCLFTFFGDRVLELIYGEGYGMGWPFLVIFSVGFLINVWTGSSMNTLIMSGGQRTSMTISIYSAILMVLSGVVLGTLVGVFGVAFSVPIAMSFQNIAAWYYVKKRTGISTCATYDLIGVLKDIRRISIVRLARGDKS